MDIVQATPYPCSILVQTYVYCAHATAPEYCPSSTTEGHQSQGQDRDPASVEVKGLKSPLTMQYHTSPPLQTLVHEDYYAMQHNDKKQTSKAPGHLLAVTGDAPASAPANTSGQHALQQASLHMPDTEQQVGADGLRLHAAAGMGLTRVAGRQLMTQHNCRWRSAPTCALQEDLKQHPLRPKQITRQ